MNLDGEQRSKLLALARQSIEAGLSAMRWVSMPVQDFSGPLGERRGSFVTLRTLGQLRGCCGILTTERTLAEDLWRNAWGSAFADPRFSPLEAEEWRDVDLHISVLTPLEPIVVADEDELLDRLRPAIDGLALERDDASATFLPDVWEQIPDPREFVRHLKQKAGWPAGSWSPHIKVSRFTTESFGDEPSVLRSTAA